VTRGAAIVLALVGPAGCEAAARSAADGELLAAPPPIEPSTPPDTGTGDNLRSSHRCGECHVAIAESWSSSAHAGSARNPLYLAMRADAADPSCDSCHVPLAALLEPGSAVAAEGVTCDACHTARRVELGEERGRLILDPADNVKRGPLCDARDHYFHRVACVPMFEKSEMCAGCHSLARHAGATKIVVHGEYDEWKASPFGPAHGDASCQSCHMPSRPGAVAEGGDGPQRFSLHAWRPGELGNRSPLQVVLTMKPEGSRVTVLAAVHNDGAGHSLPTGLPGRRLRIEARTIDVDGNELDRWEHTYGTWLVDERGREAPFYAAARVQRDDRIAAGATREHHFALAAPHAARLELRLVQRALTETLAERFGIAAPAETLLAAGTIEIPAPGRARSKRLASAIEVIP
jgi:Cytochrome c554 and c-prime